MSYALVIWYLGVTQFVPAVAVIPGFTSKQACLDASAELHRISATPETSVVSVEPQRLGRISLTCVAVR